MEGYRQPGTMPTKRIHATDYASAAIDAIPYGIVVVDGQRVSAANRATANLLWALERGGPPERCDELFACQAPGGPCETGCLCERASTSGAALPEIRIDTHPGSAVSALWVTASPMREDPRVVLHLRPGDARDRRRRTEPHWLEGPEVRISALGRTWVSSREGPLGGRWLQQRAGAVLKYLVCQRNRVVHAEEIADALWPGAGRAGVGNVRHFMHGLRGKLEPDRSKGVESSFIVTVQGGYALNRRRVRIDADEFERAVRDGLAAAARSEDEVAVQQLEHALELYRGDLVEDEPYAEWAYPERNRLRSLATNALRELARIMLGRRDLGAAATALERLAEMEPFDVDTHRALIAVWLAQGRRTDAARRYAAYRARMAREFGEEPGFTLANARRGDLALD
jgi:DNA-binding SARP family transcriptional activator